MHHACLRLICAALVLVAAGPAQQALATVHGTVANGGLGAVVRGIGDLDGDGTVDFAVSQPGSTPGRAYVVSGASRVVLVSFTGTGAGFGDLDVNPIGDVDGDGRVDFAIGYGNRMALEVFSGASGARLYSLGSQFEYYGFACGAGDCDGDGRDDFVAMVYLNSSVQLWLLRGNTGSQIGVLTTSTQADGWLRNLGDLTGDGRPEVAACGRRTEIYDLHPIRLLRSIQLPAATGPMRSVDVADMNGDGRNELVLGCEAGQRQPFLFVVSATTGATLRSFALPADDNTQPSGRCAVLDDGNGDGVPEVIASAYYDPLNGNAGYGAMTVMSGLDGRRIGSWSGSPQFSCSNASVTGVGDVDGDGFGDFVLGKAAEAAGRGGWQLISGRGVASMLSKPVSCYSGPFPPQLGITRPVLGQVMTIAGRDAPAGAWCSVVLSLLPPVRTNLGVVGCDLWIDLSFWAVVGSPIGSPNWQLPVPLPNARPLIGLEIALQALYTGTSTPIGHDLSNAVWARLGY